MRTIYVEALSVASLATSVLSLPHETRAHVVATENGKPWAEMNITPTTDSARSIFPTLAGCTSIGDSRNSAHNGVMLLGGRDHTAHMRVVIDRARRMHEESTAHYPLPDEPSTARV